jgi:hypothetical protein
MAEFVLSHVEGQKTVKSAQLATFAMQVLRRTDQLSYLRFAFIQKGYRHVRECVPEIIGLMRYPSPQLEFLPKPPDERLTPLQVERVRKASEELARWVAETQLIVNEVSSGQ